jgi:hypothetical protein
MKIGEKRSAQMKVGDGAVGNSALKVVRERTGCSDWEDDGWHAPTPVPLLGLTAASHLETNERANHGNFVVRLRERAYQ